MQQTATVIASSITIPGQYPPVVQDLIETAELNELGAGKPNLKAKPRLEQLTAQDVTGDSGKGDRTMAEACVSGLWLLHNFLDESHQISQGIDGPTGSFWHGIMHRREGDFGNAKYWFCRVGAHPTFAVLGEKAKLLVSGSTEPAVAYVIRQNLWDANRFVDLVQSAGSCSSELNLLCRKLQRLEWDTLFAYCFRKATAA